MFEIAKAEVDRNALAASEFELQPLADVAVGHDDGDGPQGIAAGAFVGDGGGELRSEALEPVAKIDVDTHEGRNLYRGLTAR